MDKPQEPEAAETAQTTNDQAVDLPRFVSDSIQLDCAKCGHVVHTTRAVVIARSRQCGRIWNPRCPECGHPFIANAEAIHGEKGTTKP